VAGTGADRSRPGGDLPKAPAAPRGPGGIAAESLARRIDQFLASRGYAPPGGSPAPTVATSRAEPARVAATAASPAISTAPLEKPADFVCEDDVRQAVRQNRKILIGERTIVTPAARDLAEQHKVFEQAAWPR
jgi:hypothetical protein